MFCDVHFQFCSSNTGGGTTTPTTAPPGTTTPTTAPPGTTTPTTTPPGSTIPTTAPPGTTTPGIGTGTGIVTTPGANNPTFGVGPSSVGIDGNAAMHLQNSIFFTLALLAISILCSRVYSKRGDRKVHI
ncbi:hypothetical protein AABB24_027523 [Solanum stoloniferum]|uniref:Uncharacterized protein n=1 Tax=Solanum stoloniferum TaxID=62892 RepID=A0ABD2S3R0_9SOLN